MEREGGNTDPPAEIWRKNSGSPLVPQKVSPMGGRSPSRLQRSSRLVGGVCNMRCSSGCFLNLMFVFNFDDEPTS